METANTLFVLLLVYCINTGVTFEIRNSLCSAVICPTGSYCRVQQTPRGPIAVCTQARKAGQCPYFQEPFTRCVEYCSDDGDCPGREKCCGDCVRQCRQPRNSDVKPPKPGMCPRFNPRQERTRNCVGECNSDCDCQGSLKCCGSCPRLCRRPLFI